MKIVNACRGHIEQKLGLDGSGVLRRFADHRVQSRERSAPGPPRSGRAPTAAHYAPDGPCSPTAARLDSPRNPGG